MADLIAQLTPNEIDVLKYELSQKCADLIDRDFNLTKDEVKLETFKSLSRQLIALQPYRDRVPPDGIIYRGVPSFMTTDLINRLVVESDSLKCDARPLFDQMITRVDNKLDRTICERLASSKELVTLVREHAGPCEASYVTSYIYYDRIGHCSRPHVDNAFTAVTAMIGLKVENEVEQKKTSATIFYPSDAPPIEIRLSPGEVMIFFGSCVVHGRTPIGLGEVVHSLLLSFRPVNE